MKKIFSIALCTIMMVMCTTAVQAQDNNQSNKQRMTREQLAEKQGKYIAHELAFDEQTMQLTIRVVCSKGTYIRALARDIGQKLNSGAHLIALRRTRVL